MSVPPQVTRQITFVDLLFACVVGFVIAPALGYIVTEGTILAGSTR